MDACVVIGNAINAAIAGKIEVNQAIAEMQSGLAALS
jgi:hypothetical protein